MSLQIPSGLITGVSGGGVTSGTTLPVITYPQPVVIVGAASGIGSGFHLITDLSGALNVNFSGLAVSVSGDIVLVVSGGAIQVSGSTNLVSGGGPISVTSGSNLPAILGSGSSLGLSGVQVTISGGAGSPNISGGVTVSGLVGVSGAGAVNWQSGTVGIVAAGQSGLGVTAAVMAWDALSGYRPVQATSGSDNKYAINVFVVSGSVTGGGGGGGGSGQTVVVAASGVFPITMYSGALNVNISGVGAIAVQSGGTLPVEIASGFLTGIHTGTPANASGLPVASYLLGYQSFAGGWIPVNTLQGDNYAGTNALGVGVYARGSTGNYFPIKNADFVSGGTGSGYMLAAQITGFDQSGTSYRNVTTIASGSSALQVGALYRYNHISGANLVNVQSGASILHSVSVNAWVSGGQVAVYNSLSGTNTADIFAVIDFGEVTAGAMPPNTMLYDAFLTSGIVVVTSGAAIDVTVTFKNPL